MLIFTEKYQHLYATPNSGEDEYEQFLAKLSFPKLGQGNLKVLEAPIWTVKILESSDALNSNKTLGPDLFKILNTSCHHICKK